MNITSASKGELTQQISIQIGKEDFMPEVEKQLKKYQREARIPGFRPGKAPAGMIRRMFEKGMMADELNKMVGKALDDHIRENDLQLLGDPLPSADQQSLDLTEGESYEFLFDVALQPEVNISLDKNFKMTLLQVEISEKEVDDYLNDLRKRHGNVVDTEVAEEDDYVRGLLTQLGSDAQPLEGGISRENALISIKRMQEGEIRSRFIGLKVNDIITFNPYQDIQVEAEIASLLDIDKSRLMEADSDFSYQITNISRMEPAVVDEEFLASVFTSDKIESEEALRERIRRDIRESYDRESRKLFYYDAIDKLVDKAALPLPDEFMTRWIASQAKEEMSDVSASMQWEYYAPMLRRQLVESHIMKTHDVRISMEDMEQSVLELMGISLDFSADADREYAKRLTSSILQDEKQFDRIRDEVMKDKFTRLLMEQVDVEEKKVEVDEFITFVKERNSRMQ
jgi:trigger factor